MEQARAVDRLPLWRALVINPLLAVVLMVAIQLTGEFGVLGSFGFIAPLSIATISTGVAVIQRGRGPATGLLLAAATAAVTFALMLVVVLIAYIEADVAT